MEILSKKAGLKYVLMEYGALFVTILGTMLMDISSVKHLDMMEQVNHINSV